MVAGCLAGWLERKDYGHAFYMAVSAGSASAFSPRLATREETEALYKRMRDMPPRENAEGAGFLSEAGEGRGD